MSASAVNPVDATTPRVPNDPRTSRRVMADSLIGTF